MCHVSSQDTRCNMSRVSLHMCHVSSQDTRCNMSKVLLDYMWHVRYGVQGFVSHNKHSCQTPNITHTCDTIHSCAPQQANLPMDCLTFEPHMPDAKCDSFLRHDSFMCTSASSFAHGLSQRATHARRQTWLIHAKRRNVKIERYRDCSSRALCYFPSQANTFQTLFVNILNV